jgi:hypothetical protein
MPSYQEESSPCWYISPIHAILFFIICITFSFVFFTLYHYFSLLTHYFRKQECNLGAYSLQKTCQFAHPKLGISEHTNQEHQGLNHQAPKCPLPWWQLQQPAHWEGIADVRKPSSIQFRLEPIPQ